MIKLLQGSSHTGTYTQGPAWAHYLQITPNIYVPAAVCKAGDDFRVSSISKQDKVTTRREKLWAFSDTDMATTLSSEGLLPGSDAKSVECWSLLLLNDFQETLTCIMLPWIMFLTSCCIFK